MHMTNSLNQLNSIEDDHFFTKTNSFLIDLFDCLSKKVFQFSTIQDRSNNEETKHVHEEAVHA